MKREAVIDETGVYRYLLSRRWAYGNAVTWIMLNPSTADAAIDDPTIRRCIGFSKKWGYSGLYVVNLYAYRSTKPEALKSAIDPIGPEHGLHFGTALYRSAFNIAAWGACKHARIDHVLPYLSNYVIHCLGVTADGSPRHPLYVKGDVEPQLWYRRMRTDHDGGEHE
jgi:hypothetical protein